MSKKFTLKIFIIFLKKEGVYEQYLINSYRYFLTKDKVIEEIIRRINMGPQYLLLMFWWGETEEGADFWRKLHVKWRRKILIQNNKIF